ncbi:DUF3501 family protein [Alphaproteobacteria bacterium]|nr:DUF3501 family protein [Alphaproteobacteria bacterium]
MSKNSPIQAADILKREDYKLQRKTLREKMVLRKKSRRLDIGPYVTIYFENRDTILYQINEMVYIENGGEEQVKEEILAYKSLVPKGKELVATLMIEIDNPIKRGDFLGKMGGFEETLEILFNEKVIKGSAESDVERTTSDGKASSVQFVHFNFSETDINEFKYTKEKISISINHKNYKHSTTMDQKNIDELSKDFVN